MEMVELTPRPRIRVNWSVTVFSRSRNRGGKADPARLQLPPAGGRRRIGLVWASSPTFSNDKHRSIALAALAPLLEAAGRAERDKDAVRATRSSPLNDGLPPAIIACPSMRPCPLVVLLKAPRAGRMAPLQRPRHQS
jgi:hypothetical protein